MASFAIALIPFAVSPIPFAVSPIPFTAAHGDGRPLCAALLVPFEAIPIEASPVPTAAVPFDTVQSRSYHRSRPLCVCSYPFYSRPRPPAVAVPSAALLVPVETIPVKPRPIQTYQRGAF